MKVSKALASEIKLIFDSQRDAIIANKSNRIGYVNIYHKDWEINKYEKLLEQLSSELLIKKDEVLSLGYITSFPGNDDQCFHIDYDGNTYTYFIPLVDLNELNGTEYLEFHSIEDNKKYFKELLSVSNRYRTTEEVLQQLEIRGIKNDIFTVKRKTCEAFSVIKIDNYILHRGVKNLTNIPRTMFQIVCSDNFYKLNKSVSVNDAELDENEENTIKIKKTRQALSKGRIAGG